MYIVSKNWTFIYWA